MNTLLVLLATQLSLLPPLQPDTPPPLPVAVSKLAELRTMQDVIAVTLLADGSRAPTDLVLPELINRRQTLQFMRVHYPEPLRNVSSKSTPIAWMLVADDGRVRAARLVTSSGQAALDSLSLQVLSIAEFKPARSGGRPVGVWVPFPAGIPPYNDVVAMLTAADEAQKETAYTQKPILINRNQVEAAIIRIVHQVSPQVREFNEAMARSQRIGGTAQLQIRVDAQGSVQEVLLKKTTGNSELDNAAQNIAKMMRFSPARNGETPVEAWIEVPIHFKAN